MTDHIPPPGLSPETPVLAIADITVGERHRKDLGDIPALAASIAELGLLQPIVVTPDHKLIAGHRRIAAFEELGRTNIPVMVIDLDDLLRGERAENTMRKDFTPSEAVAIGKALEERERELAHARETLGKVFLGSERGKTLDKVGAALGMSGTTYARAKAVARAAETDPETFGPIAAEMDRTGKVYRAFNQTRALQKSRGEPSRRPYKGRESTAERYALIRQMAEASNRPATIAAAVGMGEANIRLLLGRWHIPTVEARIGKQGGSMWPKYSPPSWPGRCLPKHHSAW